MAVSRRLIDAAALCAACVVMLSANMSAARDVPRQPAAGGAVLVEMGGWQIFARHAASSGARVEFRQVEAVLRDDPRWRLAAARLEVARDPVGPRDAQAFVAEGDVRLAGPDGLYIIAQQALSVRPQRAFTIVADTSPLLWVGDGWALAARRAEIDLRRATGRLEQLGERAMTGDLAEY